MLINKLHIFIFLRNQKIRDINSYMNKIRTVIGLDVEVDKNYYLRFD